MRYYIAVVVLIFIIVFSSILAIMGGNDAPTPAAQTPSFSLLDPAAKDATIRITIDGRIIADEDHEAISISISRSEKTLDWVTGYQGVVAANSTYDNNEAAFEVLLRALHFAGFASKRVTKLPVNGDERGVCPAGKRYIYEVIDSSGDKLVRLWNSDCGDSKGDGTFGGNRTAVIDLMQKQIQDYKTLTSEVRL